MAKGDPYVSVQQLLEELELGLAVAAGHSGVERALSSPRVQKPGLALAGFAEQLDPSRMQILGGTEIQYLRGVAEEQRAFGVDALLALDPVVVVVTRGLEPLSEVVAGCDSRGIPLLVTELATGEFIARATSLLQDALAPSTSLHGVLLDVLGVGVLLLGKSGIGKSEAALDLLVRGHRLVADDIVNLRRKGANLVYGSGSEIIRHHMEIRGLGIINIKDLFGISAVRDAKKIELVIELAEWDADEEYERLGIDDQFHEVLGAQVPRLRVPVRPGRSIATIIEVAARNQLLKFMGHHSARAFQEQLGRAIAESPSRRFDTDLVE